MLIFLTHPKQYQKTGYDHKRGDDKEQRPVTT